MKLNGRILYLLDDAQDVRAQLDGHNFAYNAEPLAFAVNTDGMISGQACTLGYTGEILGPHFLKNFKNVVDEGDVKSGGFAKYFNSTTRKIYGNLPGAAALQLGHLKIGPARMPDRKGESRRAYCVFLVRVSQRFRLLANDLIQRNC